jgi:hypothetical protein
MLPYKHALCVQEEEAGLSFWVYCRVIVAKLDRYYCPLNSAYVAIACSLVVMAVASSCLRSHDQIVNVLEIFRTLYFGRYIYASA